MIIKLILKMATFNLILLSTFLLQNCYASPRIIYDDDNKFEAPQIEPQSEDVTIDMNSNYKLRCESNKPIKWFYYDSELNPIDEKIQLYSTQNPDRSYGIELTLINVTAYNVRYYFCIYNNIDVEEKSYGSEMEQYEKEKIASKIYLFVNDLDKLLVQHYLPVITAEESKNAIIPCKPTHKGIEVQLQSSNQDESYYSNKPTDKVKFNPKLGFILKTEGQIDTGHYTCTPTKPSITNEAETIVFFLNVLPKREFEKGNVTSPQVEFLAVLNGGGDYINNGGGDFDNYTINNNNNNNNKLIIENLIKIFTTTASIINTSILPTDILYNTNNTDNLNTIPIYSTISTTATTITNDNNNYNPFTMDSLELTTESNNYIKKYSASPASLPNIRDVKIVDQPFNGHVIDGNVFNLTCQITRDPSTLFQTTWSHPNMEQIKKENRWIVSNDIVDDGGSIVKKVLTILNAKKMTDSGKYKCTVDDANVIRNQFASIKVLDENEYYIDLYQDVVLNVITVNASKRVDMVVKYIGHPHPNIIWKKPDQTIIAPSDNSYEIKIENTRTVLTIKSPQLRHSGYYTVVAANEYLDKEYKFLIHIRDKPILHMEDIYYQMIGKEMKIHCRCDGYPKPKISWTFTPCKIHPKWPNCDERRSIIFDNKQDQLKSKSTKIKEIGIHQVHELIFTPTEPGIIQCRAVNSVNETKRNAEIRIGDIEEPISILNSHTDEKIAINDKVTLTCAALAYNYSANVNWYHNEMLMESNRDIDISMDTTKYSYQKHLNFKNIQKSNAGTYECRVHNTSEDDNTENVNITVKVYDPQLPIFRDEIPYEEIIYKEMGRYAEMSCLADGLPKPTINWLKDGAPVNESNDNLAFDANGHVLIVKVVRPNDSEGVYKCVLHNRLGTTERNFELKISDYPPGIHYGWILCISAVILILLLSIIFLCIRVYKDAQIRKKLKEIGIEHFEKGAVEHINPALSLDEQAELLPYDKRFEFPREKLHLGKQLGAGAFGIVHKATADGIIPDEKETTVAVKMVKKTADNEVVRALVSELKIMVHLGQHLNVVNLLGCITKNLYKREVMVIVEYCRYGNVQNFLLKNRKHFINQINPESDLIDPSIISNGQRFSNDFEYNSQGLRYVNVAFSNQSYKNSNNKSDGDPRPGTRAGRPNSSGYIRQSDLYYGGSQVDSAMTQQTMVHSVPEGEEVLSNNSVQPVWRSNYKSDSTDTMEITTSHLVSWAFQVARGMEYLASRKVLHGDLAARNILLCEDNVVKICDFGLARSMYKNDNYKKDKDARLPVKWLALESLGDRVFSTRSDVWSFGIVLWEFFSLSKVPYPGMEADQSLYERLKDGYRMEKPPYANKELYEIMLECWRTNPDSRPLFDELERRFAKMLEEEVTNHYIDLNEQYLRVNAEYERAGQTDYLALMGSPDDMAPAPPRYVNGIIGAIPEIKIDNPDNYLKMSPKSSGVIFSPRATEDDYVQADHFNFPQPNSPTISNNMDSPIPKNRNKTSPVPEEIPMLARQSQSDSDAELSPDVRSIVKKFQNFDTPSPIKMHTTDLSGDDNYIKKPTKPPIPDRTHIGKKDAFSNPSYLILQNINEKNK